jgi:hypothetical protein
LGIFWSSLQVSQSSDYFVSFLDWWGGRYGGQEDWECNCVEI